MQLISTEQKPDILVTASQGQPLVAVEVKRRPFDQSARHQVEEYSLAVGAEFVMAVDPQQILVAPTQNGVPDWEQAITLSTSSILRHYTDVSDLENVEDFYLEGLTEAWLRDFSYSWKSKRPPGYDELDQIGLASRLRNSETHSQL
ncbi:MAG TPA: hypothetical protein VGO73_05635 [Pyrinomonadaceae bacterium]|jgi:hypothetical protein|nr:hypothetical protein [Pyrinomonadaceae bacterium]